MPVANYAMGQLNPILYFVDSNGTVSLPPSTDAALGIKSSMGKRGWELKEAGTLAEVDALQKRLQDQEYRENQAAMERDEMTTGQLRKQVRDRLVARMVSSSTRPYERDFIQSYLMLREEKRGEYRKKFTADVSYFMAREFNSKTHLHSIIDSMPEMKDEICTKCGEFRRVNNTKLCLRCLGESNG